MRRIRHGARSCSTCIALSGGKRVPFRRRLRRLLLQRWLNEGAHALYLRRGFTEVARRRGYYPAQVGREDAIVLTVDL